MKKILYIGNKLQNQSTNTSCISTLGSFLTKEGYTIYYASSYGNKVLRLIDMIQSCLRLSKKTDLVLIDTYSTQNFYYALIISQLCRRLKLPYIPILHGGNLPQRLKSHPKKCQLIFEHAKYNVSPSLFLKTAFEYHGYTNVVHIPNTIEIKNYPFLKRDCKVPKLLWVRSFAELYNPKLAVKVFKLLKDKYPKAQMCMIGPDPSGILEGIKQMSEELNLDIEFTGKLGKKEWIKRSKDFNIFINTTNFDNMPVSVIEAMALGLPVVSTNVGGIPYLIKDGVTGVLVHPNDASAMTNKILKLINEIESRELITINARKLVEQFDWNMVKNKWHNILLKS